MTESSTLGKDLGRDRRILFVAVLPPLLFGIGVAADSFIRGGPWNTIPTWRLYLSIVTGLFPMFIIAVGGLYALARGLPDWGLTWVGSGFMGFVLLVKTASEELADVGRFLISPWADLVLMVLILVAGLVILSYAATKGLRRAALFSIGMASILNLSLFLSVTSAPFYRHDLALLAAPVGLLLLCLTYAYILGPDRLSILTFLGLALLNLAPVFLANQVWGDWLSSENKPTAAIPLMVLITLILFSGPAMGVALDPLFKLRNRSD